MSRESESRRLGRTRGDIRCGGLSLRRLAGRLRRWCTGRALNDVPLNNIIFHGGEKAQRRIPTDYLDWALSDFSGYIAADELYDGPFCVLSIVDNRTFKRLSYHVLDRDPTQVDIEAFFRRFRQALEARALTVQCITTDSSTLYPEPIAAVFGAVPHQVCQFHILHEVNKAILSAVAQERKRLAAGAPKLPRGRPSSKAAKRAARRKKRIKQKVGELFAHLAWP